MRLIDADALKDSFALNANIHIVKRLTVLGVIAKAPTIEAEPVSRGRWIVTEAWPHRVYCSNCYKTYAQKAWAVWYDGTLPRRYCPACGALMEEWEE